MIIRAITETKNNDGSTIFAVALVKSRRSVSADEIKLFTDSAQLFQFLKGARV